MQNVEIRKFKKVLVANRGEIAIRVYRALNELGIQTVGIFSKEDKYALFRTKTDEAYMLNPEKGPLDAYLDINNIIKIAKAKGVDAIHPGYGFLSENPEFVEACEKEGIAFIGPNVDVMYKMGDKISSKKMAIECNVPIIPGVDHAVRSLDEVMEVARKVGYPVMLKASNGGGGRGMRIVNSEEEMPKEFEEARNEAKKAFGDDKIFVEKYLRDPKHIEVQVLADNYGNVVHLYDRDCSVQRRNQKLVEEAPAPFLSSEVTDQLETYSRRLFEAVDYEGLGTCEFMVTEQGKVYFLEVNPRLQVEHTVSEEVCGLDLVREQLTIANGGELTVNHPLRGHSFELRLTCEDPAKNLAPSSGTLASLRWPSGPGIRVDSGVVEGDTISPKFDSMMGKLVVTASDRAAAVARVRRALSELKVEGVPTPASLFEQIFNDDEFTAEHGVAYDVSTKWLERKYLNKEAASSQGGQPASMSGASEVDKKESSETFVIEVNNRRVSLTVPNDIVANLTGGAKARDAKRAIQPLRGQGLHHAQEKQQSNDGQSGVIASPMQAVVTRINVAEGQQVAKGDLLVVLESMKMENYVYAPVKGAVTKIFVGPAAGVEAGETLMTIDVTGASGTEAGENGATGAAVDGTATDGTMEGGK